MQQWQRGELLRTTLVSSNERCRLSHLQREWMFNSDACVNGLAHGSGLAASLDGDMIIADGRFVLGRVVGGELTRLPTTEVAPETLEEEGG